MRTIIFIFFTIFVISCRGTEAGPAEKSAATEKDEIGTAKIVFEETEHDFGRVMQGEKVGWYFKYRNEGNSNLIINRVTASCGCTVPEYDRKPLAPGKEASLKVMYDSNGRSGKEIKTISMETNAEPSQIQLKLMVEVVTK